MKPIRVLVANRPRLMRELVLETISDQPDIEVVGAIQEESDIQAAVDQTQPDFLIVALDDQDRLPSFCQSILQSHSQLRLSPSLPTATARSFTGLRSACNPTKSSHPKRGC